MLEKLKNEANLAYTENGALTCASSRSHCLDLFATIGAIRREGDQEIIDRFLKAYAEDADTAMKLLVFRTGYPWRTGRAAGIPGDHSVAGRPRACIPGQEYCPDP